MKTAPIVPARIGRGADDHPPVAAEVQARDVFLAGNGLPARWQGTERFTILETGFGPGHNFLAAWDAWRRDPRRSSRLVFVSIELHPPERQVLDATHRDSAVADLAAQLVAAWPPATQNLHRLAFDGRQVELLLAFGDAGDWLRELELSADAFFLDDFAPARDPDIWDAKLCKSLARLAAPDATLAARTTGHVVLEHLAAVGFEVRTGLGAGNPRDFTRARFRPVHTPPPTARRRPHRPAERRTLIVGGGLAGAATAAALAERGWRSTLFERGATLAAGASGNPAGIFHGTVHAEDGVHARFARAAALALAPIVDRAVAGGTVGAANGLLRLETRLDLPAMRALLARAGLSAAYVEAVDAGTASALAGLALGHPAWHYPRGGWIEPAGLVSAWVAQAAGRLDIRTGVDIASFRPTARGWEIVDASGVAVDAGETLILANAGAALRLLGAPKGTVASVRGQISRLRRENVPPALATCRLPVAGGGYLIPTPGGIVFGATRQPGDDDGSVRDADHRHNVDRLEGLVGASLDIDVAALDGRTAWRFATHDRLPLIGAVPKLEILRGECPFDARWRQPRHVPRAPGLFVFAALGSRGLTTSALGAEVLAAAITGAAVPLEASLVDAVDPARFVSRTSRRAEAPGGSSR